MYRRFLEETLAESNTLTRDRKQGKTASVEFDEALHDNLLYFTDKKRKDKLSNEYYKELKKRLIPSQAIRFIEIINKFWTDGYAKRYESDEVIGLMKGIERG